MARDEQDRENLLRDASALVERVELLPNQSGGATSQASITAGFRRPGAISIYFGPDPVYHFNTFDELRRAYCDGRLFKAELGRLVGLTRSRTDSEVQLVRHELSDAEQDSFVGRIQADLDKLSRQLTSGQFRLIGQVPPRGNVVERLAGWLARIHAIRVANSAQVEGERTT